MTKLKIKLNKTTLEIDRLGLIKEEMSALQAEEKALERRLRRKTGRREGLYYTISVWEAEQRRLDPDKVLRKLGSLEFGKCFSSSKYVTSRVTKKGE